MINPEILHQITTSLGEPITNINAVAGGDINRVYSINTSKGKYIIKINSRDEYPGMFKLEQEGLQAISDTATIKVPHVILNGDTAKESFLLMEHIASRRPTTESLWLLGIQLAAMHKCGSTAFGWHNNNYIGSLRQLNNKRNTWTNFYIEQRLQPLVTMAFNRALLSNADLKNFEALYKRLPSIFDEEQPSLVHGDLWSGNYLIAEDESPYLIDPAVYYGHREMDIAMSALFGGFGDDFYKAYNEAFKLNDNWKNRIELWNLYPLLVHVNLFGRNYVPQLQANLKKYL
jgi:protein-ribulosamine 3-kinase